MDSEPHLAKKPSSSSSPEYVSPGFNKDGDQLLTNEEDPYSLSGTSVSLFGLAIAFIMLVIPLLAVLIESPVAEKNYDPISLDNNGSKSHSPISISWISKPSSRDSCW